MQVPCQQEQTAPHHQQQHWQQQQQQQHAVGKISVGVENHSARS
jgi:hypothetical protein